MKIDVNLEWKWFLEQFVFFMKQKQTNIEIHTKIFTKLITPSKVDSSTAEDIFHIKLFAAVVCNNALVFSFCFCFVVVVWFAVVCNNVLVFAIMQHFFGYFSMYSLWHFVLRIIYNILKLESRIEWPNNFSMF